MFYRGTVTTFPILRETRHDGNPKTAGIRRRQSNAGSNAG